MAEFGNNLFNEGTTNQGSTSQEKQSPSPTGTQQHNIRPNTLNTGQDAYWFAHAADPPQDRSRHQVNSDQEDQDVQKIEGENSPNETEGNASNRTHRNRTLVSPTQSECKDETSPPLSQNEREERFRIFKERQEGERMKRLTDLQQQSIAAQRFREMQEDERRRRIEELRQKDLERRIAVEERKRQIWEAEQERKEAIVRRNLEREAKIEARRNAQRNSMSFAFGSSTPRVIDLDLGGFKISSPTFSTTPPALNGRRTPSSGPSFDQKTDEVDSFVLGSRDWDSPSKLRNRSFAGMSSEATKACLTITPENFQTPYFYNTIRDNNSTTTTTSISSGWLFGSSGRVIGGEDLMSRSMVILPSSSRGRRKTDLTPTLPWERDISQRSNSPASSTGGMSASKRAVSMSRLDILAQPRRRYVVDHSPSSSNIASSNSVMGGSTSGSLSGNNGPRTTSSSMSKSMFNLANAQTFRRGPAAGSRALPRRGSGMSSSMLHIGVNNQASPIGRGSPTRLSSTPQHPLPANQGSLSSDPSNSKRMSKSMCHLALVSRPPPRPTRASRMRATLTAAQQDGRSTSVLALDQIRSSVSELRKDSPNRPRSSMSGTSEQSVTSTVSMRSQSGPRRPRPVSMVGAIPDSSQHHVPTPPQRQSRTSEKRGPAVGMPPTRPPRARSVEPNALPPPKPPPRRSPTAKAASPKPVSAPVEKPIASVPPNTIEPANQPIPDKTNDDADLIKPVKVDQPEQLVIETADTPVQAIKKIINEPEAKKEEAILPNPPSVKDVPAAPKEVDGTPAGGKPRITSEEEAKAALAEKRRLAREQAEREAELERQRQAELKRLEEERQHQEEEEQRLFEEEQLRLAAVLRKQEEEKLQRAIKEQEAREADELKRQEEEAIIRAEKEEQDRKARDEAEKQRAELEEKLKKEEEERAERKKRVEQIMKRTRAKNAAAAAASQEAENPPVNEQNIVDAGSPVHPSEAPPVPPPAAIPVNGQSEMHNTSGKTQETLLVCETKPVLDSEQQEQKVLNGFEVPVEQVIKVLDSELVKSEQPIVHTNGISSPDSVNQSPEGKVDGNSLLEFESIPGGLVSSPSIEFEQLIDLNEAQTTTNSVASNQNDIMNTVDDVNSNRMLPNNPFIAFEDNVSKKQPESSYTDLLS